MPVDFGEWIAETRERIASEGAWGGIKSLYHAYTGAWLTITKRFPVGTNIFDRDWDTLIILDACRVDAMRAVAPKYEFIEEVGSIRSLGAASFEWMPKTFTDEYRSIIGRTAYVCGNPYTERVFNQKEAPPAKRSLPFGPTEYDTVDPSDFCYLDEIAKYGFNEQFGVVPPRTVTDRAITIGRTRECDRLLVHYMQPHAPYFDRDGSSAEYLWKEFRTGEISRQEMWNAYITNLNFVLEDVTLLLSNLDAKRVVITSDHGEGFGELGTYGHTTGHPHPVLRRVPWTETTASDKGEYQPSVERPDDEELDTDLDKHLKALGYL